MMNSSKSSFLLAFRALPALLPLAVFQGCTGKIDSIKEPVQAGKGAVIRSVISGSTDQVRTALAKGGDVNENIGTDKDQVTPLLVAVAQDKLEIVQLLLSKGANSQTSFHGYRPEDIAFMKEKKEIFSNLFVHNKGTK